LDIRVLARKGVAEVLEFLGESEGNSAVGSDLREKVAISRKLKTS